MKARTDPKTGRRVWRVRWREGGRNREKQFERKRDAEHFQAELRLALRNNRPTVDQRTTVGDVLDAVEAAHLQKTSQRNADAAKRIYRLYLRPDLEGWRVVDLTPYALDAYFESLRANGVGAATINKTRSVLSAALGQAVAWQMIQTNPVLGTRRLPERKRAVEPFTAEQVHRLADAAHLERDRALITVGCFTGLRMSELFALQWEDIADDVIRVRAALDLDRSLKSPKTYASRDVYLFDVAGDALNRWRELAPPTPTVFPQSNGEPLRKSNWSRRAWKPTVTKAEIPYRPPGQMRHTYASLMIANGAPVTWLSQQMGHNRTSITLDTYTRQFAALDESVTASLNAKLSR